MKLYAFDDRAGRSIDLYGTVNVLFTRITNLKADAQIGFMDIQPGGVIGYHQATMPQLFLVVEGEGWVRERSEERVSIRRGEAAFWEAGEWHESGSHGGMAAIVIEVDSAAFDPGATLPEILNS
jgi:quercetin dioxygenase-like cupin family protein